METLTIVLLIIGLIILTIGLIRVMIAPYSGFWNLIIEMVLIDCLIDLIGFLLESLAEAFND
jgi:hypothetical protein